MSQAPRVGRWARQLRYLSGQIQVFEFAHLNIYPINELLECVKGLDLQIQNTSPKIFKTRVNNGISEMSLSEVLVLTEEQKPEALYQTNKPLP